LKEGKGLDDDQILNIKMDITESLKELCNEEDEGFLYNMHESLREILSSYNDTLKGRCSVCLEQFCEDEEQAVNETFTDRPDLVRIDGCFHRFHLLCVYRDWFMKRHVEKDSFGNKIEFDLPEEFRCPVCRSMVKSEDIDHIKEAYESQPGLEDNVYCF